MADRFKRHIKNRMDKEAYFSAPRRKCEDDGGEHAFDIIKENKPTCAAGNAATFRGIRYRISSNKIFDNYTSHIGVFPLCSRVNVLNSYRAAATFTITSLCLLYWSSSANPVSNDIFVPAGYASRIAMMVEHHHENLTPVLACHFLLHGIRRGISFAAGGRAGRAGDERVHAVYRYRHVGIDDGALSFFKFIISHPEKDFLAASSTFIGERAAAIVCVLFILSMIIIVLINFITLVQRRRVFFPQRILGPGRHFAVAECRAVGGMVGV